LPSIIIAAKSLIDFKSTTTIKSYVSTSFKSKVKDKEEKKKKKFGGGASNVVVNKGKTKLMGAQGKDTN
jgi:hypothetical protein